MFFRRKRTPAPGFAERIASLRAAGFETGAETGGRVRATRGACTALIEDSPAGPCVVLAGRLRDNSLARLVDVGFQKFWRTPDGRDIPALAEHLEELHAFQEDLRETLGLVSLYNTSLIRCFGVNSALRLMSRSSPCGIGSIT